MNRDPGPHSLLRRIRELLLAIIALVMVGTGIDLVLLDHYEDGWQLVPLVLLASGLLIVAAVALTGARAAVLALQCIMILFIAAGIVGIAMHYLGSRGFQRELDPALSGWALFVRIVTAKAPPALAPSVMIQMGLLGLLYTYKHPALTAGDTPYDEDRSRA